MPSYNFIKVNWPWVEIDDASTLDGSYVINMNNVSAVYDKNKTLYNSGIMLKDGTWIDNISEDALKELKKCLMKDILKNKEE